MHDLVYQINVLKVLEKHGTSITFGRPKNGQHDLSELVFVDASQQSNHGQLCYLAGLLFGDLCSRSTFPALFWTSQKSQRPAKSVASAETLAAGEAVDEGKVLSVNSPS